MAKYKLVNNGRIQKRLRVGTVTEYLKSNSEWKLGGLRGRRKQSDETRSKISEAHKKVDKSIQSEILRSLRSNPTHAVWKRNHSKNFKGRWNLTDGVHNRLLHPEDAIKFLDTHPGWYRGTDNKRKSVLSRNNTSGKARRGLIDSDGIKSSKEEIRILNRLKKLYGDVKHNYLLPGVNYAHPYDFYIEEYNLLIEYDGDYWHRNDDYSNDQRRIIANDRGYKFCIIFESEYLSANSKTQFLKSLIQSISD